METSPVRRQILDAFVRKSNLKQRIFDNSICIGSILKEVYE